MTTTSTRLDHIIAGALLIARQLPPAAGIALNGGNIHDPELQLEAERRGHPTERKERIGYSGGPYSITSVLVGGSYRLTLFSHDDSKRTDLAPPDPVTPAIAAIADAAAAELQLDEPIPYALAEAPALTVLQVSAADVARQPGDPVVPALPGPTGHCDGCGREILEIDERITDDEVCGATDGPGFEVCDSDDCRAVRELMPPDTRRRFYADVRTRTAARLAGVMADRMFPLCAGCSGAGTLSLRQESPIGPQPYAWCGAESCRAKIGQLAAEAF